METMEKRKKEIKAAPSSQIEGAQKMESLFPGTQWMLWMMGNSDLI